MMTMKKQLNVDRIQSELSRGSAFFPGYKKDDSPTTSTQETVNEPAIDKTESQITPDPRKDESKLEFKLESERANTRTPVRLNGKRIITRNSFEIFEDQMDLLRKISLQEKMEGKLGSMSQMVRDAIDSYLKKKTSEK